MRILITASEVFPFAMTGGLGEVASALPKALANLDDRDNEIAVIIPLYSNIDSKYREKMEFVGNMNVQLAWRYQYCGVFKLVENNVVFYFIDNEYYFRRKKLYGEFDDGERFAFFCKCIFETMKYIDFCPDIIHANDWHTALVPIYLKLNYRDDKCFKDTKCVFSIHNIAYQGKFGMDILWDIFDIQAVNKEVVRFGEGINLMKGAIELADYVATVSPTYAEEIKDEYYAEGLEGILAENSFKLTGILNGIDDQVYDPENDSLIAKTYGVKKPDGKKECKEDLQLECKFKVKDDVPIIGVVTRLVGHKGIDLIKYILDDLMREDIRLIVLGTGDDEYEEFFRKSNEKYKGKLFAYIGFDMNFSRKVYSGADMFLMPSKSEPCGLSQMIALRYGTVPIVRETGGLKDSVTDYDEDEGSGFTFKSYNAHDMLGAIKRALGLYKDKEGWNELILNNMKKDLSWKNSAMKYMELYEKVKG